MISEIATEQLKELDQELQTMPKGDRRNVVWHDFCFLVTPTLAAFYDVQDEIEAIEEPERYLENGVLKLRNPNVRIYTTEEKLEIYEDHLRIASQISPADLDNGIPNSYRIKLLKASLLSDIFPPLKASTLLLDHPTEARYHNLRSKRTRLSKVAKALDIEDITGDREIDGVDAMALANLGRNAQKHGTGPIKVEVTDDGHIIVRNQSEEQMPENAHRLGVKGSTGNTGVGLYLADKLSRIKGSILSTYCQRIDRKDTELFSITVTLQPA